MPGSRVAMGYLRKDIVEVDRRGPQLSASSRPLRSGTRERRVQESMFYWIRASARRRERICIEAFGDDGRWNVDNVRICPGTATWADGCAGRRDSPGLFLGRRQASAGIRTRFVARGWSEAPG